MARSTISGHREDPRRPESAELELLEREEERVVYDGLRRGRWGVRLEQEMVGFAWVMEALGRRL